MAIMKQQTSTTPLKMYTLIIVLLGLCLITKAEKFDEADCRPRPTVVPIDEGHKYKPYHIVLYRCSGTFNKISPNVKTCAVTQQHEVLVDVLDENGIKTALYVKNHTKCGEKCALTCGSDMIIDDCTCKCLTGDCAGIEPTAQPVGGSNAPRTSPQQLPYLVGMALVGLFAVFVLAFDATLYVKKNGFIYTIKHSCCGRAPSMDKNKNQQCENQNMVPKGDNDTESNTCNDTIV